jgi:cation transport regulator ChaC
VPVFVFGYGSLLFRPGFPFEERAVATVRGWARRFEQGSPDHRGTPERLGRVVTLVAAPGEACVGMVYRVADADAEGVLAALDVREQGGYERRRVTAEVGAGASVEAVTWIAPPGNPWHLGPAPFEELCAQIRAAVGPSGANRDYVVALDRTLRGLGIEDAHVAAIAAAM